MDIWTERTKKNEKENEANVDGAKGREWFSRLVNANMDHIVAVVTCGIRQKMEKWETQEGGGIGGGSACVCARDNAMWNKMFAQNVQFLFGTFRLFSSSFFIRFLFSASSTPTRCWYFFSFGGVGERWANCLVLTVISQGTATKEKWNGEKHGDFGIYFSCPRFFRRGCVCVCVLGYKIGFGSETNETHLVNCW